jgi:hypothetical protein
LSEGPFPSFVGLRKFAETYPKFEPELFNVWNAEEGWRTADLNMAHFQVTLIDFTYERVNRIIVANQHAELNVLPPSSARLGHLKSLLKPTEDNDTDS